MAKRRVQRQTTKPCTVHPSHSVIGVFHNSSYQTALAIEAVGTFVKCLRISMDTGLHLELIPSKIFDKEFRPRDIEPIEKSARAYARLMQYLGASDEALECLQSIIPLTTQEVTMTKERTAERQTLMAEKQEKAKEQKVKREAAIVPTVTPQSTPKSQPVSKAKPTSKPQSVSKAKSTSKSQQISKPKPKMKSVSKTISDKKPSMSKRFRELIMEGKLTDAQIFDTVKKEYGVTDEYRWYVAWNRGWLRRHNMNPPEAK